MTSPDLARCTTHPARPAGRVCLFCRRWYCDECMPPALDLPHCPGCRRRALPAVASRSGPLATRQLGWLRGAAVGGAALLLTLVLVGGKLGPLMGLPAAVAAAVLLARALRRQTVHRPADPSPTDAQVHALLDRQNQRITPEGLARAAGTSVGAATAKLDAMVQAGILELIPDDEGNLFYSTEKLDLSAL